MPSTMVEQNNLLSKHQMMHFPSATSTGVSERARKRMSAAERASEVSSAKPANERAVQANEQTDEQVAQYLGLDPWPF